MYRVALRISPGQQRAIAAQLYVELLRGGFTHTCEFHYLHNDAQGRPYTDAAGEGPSMAEAIAAGADEAGMGLTLLPAVYERAGFTQPRLRDEQRRFAADAAAVLRLRDTLRAQVRTGAASMLQVGVALHSLCAATPAAVDARGPMPMRRRSTSTSPSSSAKSTNAWRPRGCGPSNGCCGMRRRTGAGSSCTPRMPRPPKSRAWPPAVPASCCARPRKPIWATAWPTCPAARPRVPITLGSDSNVTRSATEELRLLEYSQRLVRRLRCVAAAPQHNEPATAARLWSRVVDAGAGAAGLPLWGLRPGARADLLVIDTATPALLGVPASHQLDAMIFSSPGRPFRDVLVAGRWVTRNHHNPAANAIATRFAATMEALWQER